MKFKGILTLCLAGFAISATAQTKINITQPAISSVRSPPDDFP